MSPSAFPIGTRVFFWTSQGEVLYVTVLSLNITLPFMLILDLRTDDGRDLKLS
ncbi:hypothetical protein FA13DRAFT_1784912 [Coprinellus micaceus]|uniref:Uncharacterized protein n=1 Tax=Coprinellus micaceus TaxID=71717 RepID=A0A4Y7TWP3_COPMI|nr:hypothetical protein FA13DRAFT_1784912 [Coprinellus micaceus]